MQCEGWATEAAQPSSVGLERQSEGAEVDLECVFVGVFW
jgi:hypothetical protein